VVLQMKRIILASASPRRRELLAKIGLQFEVEPSSYDEVFNIESEPRKYARQISLGKALAVAPKYPNAIIISADTIGILDGTIIGKPKSRDEAIKILSMLSGRPHLVITGFTVLDTARHKKISRSIVTKVYFRELSMSEIESYVATGEPLDKAGAYAIQGLGSVLIKKIVGDFYNVVGLPLSAVSETLRKFGINVIESF
jgi:septum formation protein